MSTKKVQTFTIDGNTMEGEQWAFIPDYPNYFVSDAGRVYNGTTGKIVEGTHNAKGYRIVELRNEASQHKRHGKLVRVSHLVAEAFDENYRKGMIVHHVNCNNSDDRAINLMSVTVLQHLFIHNVLYKRLLRYPSLILELFKRKKPELTILIRSNNNDDDMKGGDAA